MSNEDIKRTIVETVEVLNDLPLNELLKAYGFALGLQANNSAAEGVQR